VSAICGKIEAELAELEPEEAKEYMASYGLPESGVERLIAAGYSLLGLMSFLTAGETEVRAWTIPVGTTALRAAGTIHTDFEKERGHLRLEGKDYVIQDGDVLLIRHG